MNIMEEGNKHLSQEQIESLSSKYIQEGRQQEAWEIEHVSFHDKNALMQVRMKSIYGSEKDFHLSTFVAQEMASQLSIIAMHHWANMEKKTNEVWLIESNTKNRNPVLSRNEITVKLHCASLKQINGKLYAIMNIQIIDSYNGLIEIVQKGVLS